MSQPTMLEAQWLVKRIQMINWGGFHGLHEAEFSPTSTLITGHSGTGKSTLLDAYIAAMMPSSVPFNGASNDATSGRARSKDQRNVLSYLRGKRDTTIGGDDDQGAGDVVLRSGDKLRWGAITVTFEDTFGQAFTALRTYQVPAGARLPNEVRQGRFTIDAVFDAAWLNGVRGDGFAGAPMKQAFPGIEVHPTVGAYQQRLYGRLGIGAKGDGDRAMELLATIQGGHPVKSVDNIYKLMTLEKPVTFETADTARAHFDNLELAFTDMEVADEKERALRQIGDKWTIWEDSTRAAARIDRFGVNRTGATPMRLWELRHKRRLLDVAEAANRTEAAEKRPRLAAAQADLAEVDKRVADLAWQIYENGGGAIASLEAELQGLTVEQRNAQERLDQLIRETDVLVDVGFQTSEAFTAALALAREFADRYEQRRTSIDEQRDTLTKPIALLEARMEDVKAEYDSLGGRDGLVPREYDEARKAIAQVCGIPAQDLPFVAELLDLHPDYDEWRLATEMTLGNVGLTLLMDERRQADARRKIDGLDLHPRINFDGVNLTTIASSPADTRFISGRLVFKEDSPFANWVKARVARRGADHLCVDSPADLGGEEPKVTIHGQTSRGRQGAHGRNRNSQFVLGFSNDARRKELATTWRKLDGEKATLEARRSQLGTDLARLRDLDSANRSILSCTWRQIDVSGIRMRMSETEGKIAALRSGNDLLPELERQHGEAKEQRDNAKKTADELADRVEALESEWGGIVDLGDALSREREPIEASGLIELLDDDDQYLQERLGDTGDLPDYVAFDLAASRLRSRLGEDSRSNRSRAAEAEGDLEKVFSDYNRRWPDDPNRGASVVSYDKFRKIYDEIVFNGLHDRLDDFKKKMSDWSGEDLMMLNHAYDQVHTEYQDRLDPINDILATLPFGVDGDRLKIAIRDRTPQTVADFRRKLRDLASNVASQLSDDEMRDRFKELRGFMARIGTSDGGSPERLDLLDVRRHVEVTARKIDSSGRELAVYSSLGEKSGGETQELVAFIVGAALRYRLGDSDRPKPVFAPVFLDEGFVKADWEFAGRSVRAWLGLGFQLIVSAPLDKVTALEPHMELNLAITKDNHTGYSYISTLRDSEVAAAEALRDAS